MRMQIYGRNPAKVIRWARGALFSASPGCAHSGLRRRRAALARQHM
jgi:hypothetical protein